VGDAQDFLAVWAEVDVTLSQSARESPAVHFVQDGAAMSADGSLVVFFLTINHVSSLRTGVAFWGKAAEPTAWLRLSVLSSSKKANQLSRSGQTQFQAVDPVIFGMIGYFRMSADENQAKSEKTCRNRKKEQTL
jgi:hypothetical protein